MIAAAVGAPAASEQRARLRLTLACGLYDRVLALRTGEVEVEGVDLTFLDMDSPRAIFDRMTGEQAFDIAELSCSEFIARKSAGDRSFVALPVFPSRAFRHGFIAVNCVAGIRAPRDLAGKRIGVPLHTMTAAVWIRGMLARDHGVDLSGVRWVQGAMNTAARHGDPHVMPLLKPVSIEINRSGKSLSDMLAGGELDAVIGSTLPDSLKTAPDKVQRLFPDFREVETDYYRRTGIFPVMHLIAIRRDVYERAPDAAPALYRAFCDAKAHALRSMRYTGTLRYMLPWLPDDLDEIDAVFGEDPWPYGIDANRPTLTALMEHMADQGLIAAPLPVDDLFVAVE